MSAATFELEAIDSTRTQALRSGRVGLETPVDLLLGDAPFTAVTLNVSPAGAFVATQRLLPVGSRVRLRLPLPNYGVPFVVDAEVRWLRSAVWAASGGPPAGMGVQFIDPPIGMALCMAELVAAREAR